jgi:aminopeptidase-like protein
MNIYNDMSNLYPMCRSITGKGIEDTLKYIQKRIPIDIEYVPTGTEAFDWKVPKEWNIKDAWIKNSKGEKIVDIKDHYLHVLNYSIPINKKISLAELKKHLYTLSNFPDWIPYRTTYYQENWGFCMKHNDFLKLEDEEYEVFIDSTLEDGNLCYGELLIKGESEKEILISSYCCHPQQCNDSLSGTVFALHLVEYLLKQKNYYSYRFVFIPETIGAIIYVSKNLDIMKKNIIGGYTLTCLGDEGDFTYLKTRKENQMIDKITLHLLEKSGLNYKVREYYTCGSDERQYNYPGVDLNIGSLMKTKYGEFDEYHTSGDNLNFVTPNGLNDSYNFYLKCIELIENNHIYVNTKICEPQLGKHGLYNMVGGRTKSNNIFEKIDPQHFRRILYYLDGNNDLISISNILNIELQLIYKIIKILLDKKLIKKKI